MPELQLVRARAQRKGEQLVAQADPEHRRRPQELLDVSDRNRDGAGVARPVRQEHTVEASAGDLGRRGVRREDGDVAGVLAQQTQDVELDPEVVRGDAEARLDARGPDDVGGAVRLRRGHRVDEVEPVHVRRLKDARAQGVGVKILC